MSTTTFDFNEPSSVIFSDNFKSNTTQRDKNIETLQCLGFVDSGVHSRSGELKLSTFNKMPCITFGKRYNIGGKQRKYFTLVKKYSSIQERNEAFISLTKTLLKNA